MPVRHAFLSGALLLLPLLAPSDAQGPAPFRLVAFLDGTVPGAQVPVQAFDGYDVAVADLDADGALGAIVPLDRPSTSCPPRQGFPCREGAWAVYRTQAPASGLLDGGWRNNADAATPLASPTSAVQGPPTQEAAQATVHEVPLWLLSFWVLAGVGVALAGLAVAVHRFHPLEEEAVDRPVVQQAAQLSPTPDWSGLVPPGLEQAAVAVRLPSPVQPSPVARLLPRQESAAGPEPPTSPLARKRTSTLSPAAAGGGRAAGTASSGKKPPPGGSGKRQKEKDGKRKQLARGG